MYKFGIVKALIVRLKVISGNLNPPPFSCVVEYGHYKRAVVDFGRVAEIHVSVYSVFIFVLGTI